MREAFDEREDLRPCVFFSKWQCASLESGTLASGTRLGVGMLRAHDLHESHQLHRIEVVQPDEAVLCAEKRG